MRGLATLEGLPRGNTQQDFRRLLLESKAEMVFDIFSAPGGYMQAQEIASLLRALQLHELGSQHEPEPQMLVLRSQAFAGDRCVSKQEFVSRALQGIHTTLMYSTLEVFSR